MDWGKRAYACGELYRWGKEAGSFTCHGSAGAERAGREAVPEPVPTTQSLEASRWGPQRDCRFFFVFCFF